MRRKREREANFLDKDKRRRSGNWSSGVRRGEIRSSGECRDPLGKCSLNNESQTMVLRSEDRTIFVSTALNLQEES